MRFTLYAVLFSLLIFLLTAVLFAAAALPPMAGGV